MLNKLTTFSRPSSNLLQERNSSINKKDPNMEINGIDLQAMLLSNPIEIKSPVLYILF